MDLRETVSRLKDAPDARRKLKSLVIFEILTRCCVIVIHTDFIITRPLGLAVGVTFQFKHFILLGALRFVTSLPHLFLLEQREV